jgi:hypothetical protein
VTSSSLTSAAAAPRSLGWVSLGLGSFAAAFALSVVHGSMIADQAWYVQLTSRVLHGAVPYRDVFVNTTPLALYMTTAVAWAFGSSYLALAAAVDLIFAAIVVGMARLAAQLGIGRRGRVALVLAAFAYIWTQVHGTPYSPLAYLLLLGCLSATLAWAQARERRVPLIAAGVAAGLCLMAKQNVGALAVLALVGAIVVADAGASARVTARHVALALAAAAGAAALVFLPVAIAGGTSGFVHDAFLDRTRYAAEAGTSYFSSFGHWVGSVFGGELPGGRVSTLFLGLAHLFPVVAAAALGAVLWSRPGLRRRAAILALFSAAAVAGMYPQFSEHFGDANVVLLPVIAFAVKALGRGLAPRIRLAALAGCVAWCAVGMAASIAIYAKRSLGGDPVVSSTPHFGGIPVDRAAEEALGRQAGSLADLEARHGPVFLLTPAAGLLYLASGVSNPTRFDLPLPSDLGDRGERRVIGDIAAGRIRSACVAEGDQALPRSLRADQPVAAYIRSHMTAGDLLPSAGFQGLDSACRVYVAAP